MKLRFITAYLLNIFDLIATLTLVKLYGVGIEANVLAKCFISNTFITSFIKIVIVGILIVYLYKSKDKHLVLINIASWLIFIIYLILFVYHIIIFTFLLIL